METGRLTASFRPLSRCVTGCRDSAPDDLIQRRTTTEALVFVKTTGEETLNRTWADGQPVQALADRARRRGHADHQLHRRGDLRSVRLVRRQEDPVLDAPAGRADRNIYEIDADGTGLRQVTSGGGHDFDPLYLPDGRIMFTSSRDGEMDEYNHAPAEHLYACNADGSEPRAHQLQPERRLRSRRCLPDGRIVYTRWEHFGHDEPLPAVLHQSRRLAARSTCSARTAATSSTPQPTPDGRLIAIESTDDRGGRRPDRAAQARAGPGRPGVTGRTPRTGTCSPRRSTTTASRGRTAPSSTRSRSAATSYVASYTLPAATEEDVDYGLYTFTLDQTGAGTPATRRRSRIRDLTFLYNDPTQNEYDAQLLAPHAKPPVIASIVDRNLDYGVFLAQDVFNRGTNDGQECPVRGIDPIDSIAVHRRAARRCRAR